LILMQSCMRICVRCEKGSPRRRVFGENRSVG
jgi:hypothetical protein